MRERDLIQWIRSRWPASPQTVPVGPGDDCAIVQCGPQRLLMTVDQVLDGVHFILDRDGPAAAGRKAMARNLSDIAAMAGDPLCAVVSAALPKGLSESDCRSLYEAMEAVGRQFRCPIVGGDIGTWPGALAISVTILGKPAAGIEPVLRSGARAGDALCVTGSLGGAWKTRRHLEFTPRLLEANVIASNAKLHAMIDISDGLTRDLDHICRESGVGAELIASAIPVHADAEGLRAAMEDGEDYELLFTLSPEDAEKLLAKPTIQAGITRIGVITAEKGLRLLHDDGRRETIVPGGWEHQT